jgi:yecA family protein
MAAAAMPLNELEPWLQARAEQHPVATSLPVLDGYVAAIVAGPVSISAPDWICPLLAIDADAFNHGGTPEFAAISAVALRHNDISNVLSAAPHRFAPIHGRKPNGDVDARPWCQGFHAAMRLRLSAWAAARRQQHTPRLAPAHPAALRRRSRASITWTTKERPRDRAIPAQRPYRHSARRRGHAPVLDADPLRLRALITPELSEKMFLNGGTRFPVDISRRLGVVR